MKPKITLFVMTQKGLTVLKALNSEFDGIVGAVVSARDPNVKNDFYDEICNFCGENEIEFYNRKDAPAKTNAYIIAISWRWLIESATSQIIIFHDSLLPRLRGFNPLVTALRNGDPQIGVSAIMASEAYDCGDIIAQTKIDIDYPIKVKQAIAEVIKGYEVLALEICSLIDRGGVLPAVPQNEAKATYSLWRDDADYRIDWASSAERIKRHIDAVGDPYRGASAWLTDSLVRIIDAEVTQDVIIENRDAGKVLRLEDEFPVVVCGEGLLKLMRVETDSGESLLPLQKFRSKFE